MNSTKLLTPPRQITKNQDALMLANRVQVRDPVFRLQGLVDGGESVPVCEC